MSKMSLTQMCHWPTAMAVWKGIIIHSIRSEDMGNEVVLDVAITVSFIATVSAKEEMKWPCSVPYKSSFPGFPGGSEIKCLPAMRETWVRSLDPEDPLEKEMATHSSILARRIPELDTTERLHFHFSYIWLIAPEGAKILTGEQLIGWPGPKSTTTSWTNHRLACGNPIWGLEHEVGNSRRWYESREGGTVHNRGQEQSQVWGS